MQNYELIIASDHAGFNLKSQVLEFFNETGYEIYQNNAKNFDSQRKKILDLGCYSAVSVDYPDYAKKVIQKIAEKGAKYGILICGTGVGMSIVANRNPAIRAALCLNEFMAEMARAHNDANVLVLAGRFTEESLALQIIDKFLHTKFAGERHEERVNKINL